MNALKRKRPGVSRLRGVSCGSLPPPGFNPTPFAYRSSLPGLEEKLPMRCTSLGMQITLDESNVFEYLRDRGLLAPGEEASLEEAGDARPARLATHRPRARRASRIAPTRAPPASGIARTGPPQAELSLACPRPGHLAPSACAQGRYPLPVTSDPSVAIRFIRVRDRNPNLHE